MLKLNKGGPKMDLKELRKKVKEEEAINILSLQTNMVMNNE